MQYTQMKDLLEKNHFSKIVKIGEIIEGKIVGKGKSSVFLDLGPIGTGIIYGREYHEAKEHLKKLKTGDKVFSKILDFDVEGGYIDLSASGALKKRSFDTLKETKETGELIKVKILGANRGGLTADLFGVAAFLPVSQLSREHYPKVKGGDKLKILKELQSFIGQEIEVKILDLFPDKGQIILSEKAKDLEKMKDISDKYNVGDVVDGEITGITNFGAFVKFPVSLSSKDSDKETIEELEGLIHISELDWKIIADPAEIVKAGDKVKAKIVDISNGKISLSLKALKEDPWNGVNEKYKEGKVVSGKITKLNPFGSFVQITKEIQALCHISEFEDKKMEEVLEIGEEYQFKILSVDEKKHRMNLKLVQEKNSKK